MKVKVIRYTEVKTEPEAKETKKYANNKEKPEFKNDSNSSIPGIPENLDAVIMLILSDLKHNYGPEIYSKMDPMYPLMYCDVEPTSHDGRISEMNMLLVAILLIMTGDRKYIAVRNPGMYRGKRVLTIISDILDIWRRVNLRQMSKSDTDILHKKIGSWYRLIRMLYA